MLALAVEIKSPDDSLKELREKANYYMLERHAPCVAC